MELKTLVIQNMNGNAQTGVMCHLYHLGTREYVTGLQDRDGAPLDNPFQSSRTGEAIFRAPDGVYDLVVLIAGTETTRPVQCLDVNSVIHVQQQVAQLTYVAPTIDQLLIDNASSKTLELGSSVASVQLSWTLSGSEPDEQQINNGVGAIAVGTTERSVAGPFTSNQTWTLSLSDTDPSGATVETQRSVSLNFRHKRYWGVSESLNLASADIIALSSEFATNKGKSITYDASGGQYPYYCYPANFGALSSVTVGGLAFTAYTETIQPFTNASGHTEDYRVVRFNGLQTGANIQVVWS